MRWTSTVKRIVFDIRAQYTLYIYRLKGRKILILVLIVASFIMKIHNSLFGEQQRKERESKLLVIYRLGNELAMSAKCSGKVQSNAGSGIWSTGMAFPLQATPIIC